jgi:hypothetical protein
MLGIDREDGSDNDRKSKLAAEVFLIPDGLFRLSSDGLA